MQKQRFSKIILLSFIAIPSLFFQSEKFIEVNAENGQVHLGTRAITESGYEGIKTFISQDEVTFYQSTGRVVYSEIPGGPPIIESTGNQINGLNPDLPLPRVYYYYPTYTLPKIVATINLYNDWDSIIYMLEILEDRIVLYNTLNESSHDIIDQSLDFLRAINTNYDSVYWNLCAGILNTDLLQFIASESVSNGTTCLQFFSSFVSSQDYNYSLYGNVLNPHFGTSLYDYSYTTHEYDFIHMCASAKCFRNNSGILDIYPEFEMLLDSLTSWGGDLQQSIKYFYNNGEQPTTPTSFDQILDNSNSKFSWADFLADIDAKNLAKYGFINRWSVQDGLEKIFELSNIQRFYIFTYSSPYDSNFSTFCYAIRCVLDIEYNNEINIFDLANITPYDFYNAMRTNDGNLPPADYRNNFYTLFYNKILYLLGT